MKPPKKSQTCTIGVYSCRPVKLLGGARRESKFGSAQEQSVTAFYCRKSGTASPKPKNLTVYSWQETSVSCESNIIQEPRWIEIVLFLTSARVQT